MSLENRFLMAVPASDLYQLVEERSELREEYGVPFSYELAVISVMLDLDTEDLRPARFYARLWGWSRGRVRNHLEEIVSEARRRLTWDGRKGNEKQPSAPKPTSSPPQAQKTGINSITTSPPSPPQAHPKPTSIQNYRTTDIKSPPHNSELNPERGEHSNDPGGGGDEKIGLEGTHPRSSQPASPQPTPASQPPRIDLSFLRPQDVEHRSEIHRQAQRITALPSLREQYQAVATLVNRLWHKSPESTYALSPEDRRFLTQTHELHGLVMLLAVVVVAGTGKRPLKLAAHVLPQLVSRRFQAETPEPAAPRARPDFTPEAEVDTTTARRYLEAMPETKRTAYTKRFMAWLRKRDYATWQALDVLNCEGSPYRLSVVEQLARHHAEFEAGKIRLMPTRKEAVAV